MGEGTLGAIGDQFFRAQLEERRRRLTAALTGPAQNASLKELLRDVDSALEEIEEGTYGLCETCREPVEKERLIADPLVRLCLDHLTTAQQRALEEDLHLASRIQRALLPPRNLQHANWRAHYHYEPAGLVSGDYCDLIQAADGAGNLMFLLGDVAGKGVAASMLMAHLHAMFRSLNSVGLPLDQLVGLANRVFCESTMAGQYATLVCGRAGHSGDVEICNAGHCPSLLVRKGEVTRLDSSAVPLGMFGNTNYPVEKTKLGPGDSLILYTDGLSETRNNAGVEYGVQRLTEFVRKQHALDPDALTARCLEELKAFCSGAPRADDLTVLVIRRAA